MTKLIPLILTGPPVSRHKQRKLGIAKFVPGIGYGKRRCSRCAKNLWLGPTQLGVLEAAPDTEVVCTTCALPSLKDGTAAWTHFGGRGGSYFLQDGGYSGPPEEFQN
jgi:hypothetical protein